MHVLRENRRLTTILLHPAQLPRFPMASCQLGPGWRWWTKRVYPGPDGNLVRQEWIPNRDAIEELRIIFDPGQPTVMADPPVLRLREVRRFTGSDPLTSTEVSQHGELLMVWYGPPGPGWEPLPGNTCRPGEYRFDSITEMPRGYRSVEYTDENSTIDRDAYEQRYESGQPLLEWPHQVAMPWLGRFMDSMSVEELDAALERRYNLAGQTRLSEVYGGQLDDVLAAWQEYQRRTPGAMTPNEIRAREGLPPLPGGNVYAEPPRVAYFLLHSADPGENGQNAVVSDWVRAEIGPEGGAVPLTFTMTGGAEVAWISLWNSQGAQLLDRTRLGTPYVMSAQGQLQVNLVISPEMAAMLPPAWENPSPGYDLSGLQALRGGFSDPARNNRLPARRRPDQLEVYRRERRARLGLYGDPRELDIDVPTPSREEVERLGERIAELVNDQLRLPMDDYSRDFDERCEHCGQAWHGLPGTGATDSYSHGLGAKGCPGAFADADEVKAWKKKQAKRRR